MMEARTGPLKREDATALPGGGRLGVFWRSCKNERRCGRPPYDRLLDNPVLKTDYRSGTGRHERAMVSSEIKVEAVWTPSRPR